MYRKVENENNRRDGRTTGTKQQKVIKTMTIVGLTRMMDVHMADDDQQMVSTLLLASLCVEIIDERLCKMNKILNHIGALGVVHLHSLIDNKRRKQQRPLPLTCCLIN